MSTQPGLPLELNPSAVIVGQGKVLDFIDSKTQREETPEEYVRQEIAKSLVREYGYPKRDIAVEYVLRVGSRKPRADLGQAQPEGLRSSSVFHRRSAASKLRRLQRT